jgi:hypothetical protein
MFSMVVTAFSPELAVVNKSMELFFDSYPDGRLISLVRDPKNWLPFARIHWLERYEDVSQAVKQWDDCTQAMLWNKEKFGDKVCLVKSEDLVSKTEAVMRYLADFLGIEFDDILLVPTFNKLPLKADVSLTGEDPGVADSPLSAGKGSVGREMDAIERMTSETYSLVLREAVKFE